MRCEICRCHVVDAAQAAVEMATAARCPAFLEALADDYFDTYGVSVTRGVMSRLAETVGGHVTLCPECQVRLTLAEPAEPVEPGTPSLASTGPSVDVPRAVADLSSPDPDRQLRAAQALREAGEAAVEPLTAWLMTWRGDRAPGVRVLGYLGAEAAAPALVEVLLQGTVGEQAAACGALANLGAGAVPSLESALQSHRDSPAESRRLLRALGEVGRPAVSLLCAYLADPEPEISRAAWDALEVSPWPNCVDTVAPFLSDADKRVRRVAAVILGRTGDPRAARSLVESISDPATEVRVSAGWSLTRLGYPLPGDAVEQVVACRLESWLYAGLVQLCGLDADTISSLLTERGIRLALAEAEVVPSAERVAQAKELRAQGACDAAAELLRTACRELPFDTGPLALLAQWQSQEKQWGEAAEALSRLLVLEPFAARWHHNLGVAQFHLGDRPAALEQWRQALLLDPAHAAAREALARVGAEVPAASAAVCVAHPSALGESQCAACGAPLCRDCAYPRAEGSYCERHAPLPSDENRRYALHLVALAREGYEGLRRAMVRRQMSKPAATADWGSEAVATVSAELGGAPPWVVAGVQAAQRARTAGDTERLGRNALQASLQALYDALAYDPGCESAVLLLCELGERCEAAGLPPAVPETEQRRALIACAWYDPAASTARFLARCEVDCCAALRDYFAYLARDPALRWDDGTLRVIDTAAERRLWEELLTYLRAILPQLPAHSTARRQCRARIRSLGAGARG